MKTRDSGMPEEDYWSTFFKPEAVLTALGLDVARGPVLDVGCGYGTFTIPAAQLTRQRIIAVDIEPELVQRLNETARTKALSIEALVRDVARDGLGLSNGGADIVLLFNLLHCEDPASLLREAHRVLSSGGRVGVIHWRSDVTTPRGPDLSIRPRPETCRKWLVEVGFSIVVEPTILEPYHFGLVGRKP